MTNPSAMKTTKKKTMTKHLLLLCIFHFFDSLLTMWSLFLVCWWYHCDYITTTYPFCVNPVNMYKQNSLPGEYCCTSRVNAAISTVCENITSARNRYLGEASEGCYYYCENYIRVPYPTPTRTFMPSPIPTLEPTPARTYMKLSVKCQPTAKVNNLAFLTALLQ